MLFVYADFYLILVAANARIGRLVAREYWF